MTDLQLANNQIELQAKIITELNIKIEVQEELIAQLQESNESLNAFAEAQLRKLKS